LLQGVLIQSGIQGLLAFVMHCADVATSFMNDEVGWQDAYDRYAMKPDAFVPRAYHFKWRTVALFAAKTGMQWVLGYTTSIDGYFTVSFAPLAVVTALMLLVAIMLEVLARRKPRSGGPTTYGEFRLLVKYISEYHLAWL
jgi:hypothetical protein